MTIGLNALKVRMSPWRTWWFFVRSDRWFFVTIGVVTLLASALEAIHVAAFFPVFHSLISTKPMAVGSRFLDTILGWTQALPFRDPVVAAAVFLFAVTVLKTLSTLWREILVAQGAGRVQHRVKMQLMDRYVHAPYLFFLDARQGQLLYNVSTAPARVGVLTQKLPKLVAETLKGMAITVVLFLTFPLAAAVLGVAGLGYLRLTHWLSRKISYHTGQGRAQAGAAQISIAQEFLTGIRQIFVFGTAFRWLEQFRAQSRRFRDLFIRDAIWVSAPKNLLELSSILFLLGMLLVLHWQNPGSLGTRFVVLGVFGVGLLKLLPAVTLVGQLKMEIANHLADAELLHRFFHEPLTPVGQGGRSFDRLQQGIFLDKLSFHYPNKPPLFDRIQLELKKGHVTALVGPSGSGKTTLVNLLLGLLEPTGGSVQIDGTPLSNFRLESWQRCIGFVPQDLFVFHDSVLENIRFGRSEYTLDQVRQAAQKANAHQFIESLPQGYETQVGERGMKLSGGQQQRLCIARAILHDPEILIFDEATSFLDAESEQLIQEALEGIARQRTVLLVAHRLNTVERADQIVVLDQGKVVEVGTHPTLLERDGRYAKLMTTGRHNRTEALIQVKGS